MLNWLQTIWRFALVALFVTIALVLTYLVFELAGAKKIIEWSRGIGFFAFGLAIWVGMIVKLSDSGKSDFLPEWERIAFGKAVANLRAQIWACFFFTIFSSTVGVCAGVFSETPYQDGVAIFVLFLTFTTLGTLLFIPVFWGRIAASIRYLTVRENEEKARTEEVAALVKAMETPYVPPPEFRGYGCSQ